jgi:cytosine deaminase
MQIKFADISWPTEPRYWLANARVPTCMLGCDAVSSAPMDAEGVVKADLLIEDAKLARIATAGAQPNDGATRVDLGGRQVWPMLIDIHTHLDKGHSVDRSPNADGTFHNARLGAIADRVHWTVPDLRRRMDFGLRCAHAHGVSAIRTHIDTYQETIGRNWQAVREMRDEWRGKVDYCRTNSVIGSPPWWPSRRACSAA